MRTLEKLQIDMRMIMQLVVCWIIFNFLKKKKKRKKKKVALEFK